MRKLAALAAISGVAALGGLAVASSVSAESNTESTGTITQLTTSYSNPTNESIPVHDPLVPNQNVAVRCVTEGQSLGGDATWYRIGRDDKLGFVHASTIETAGHVSAC
jgi:hypothetical protein